METLHILRSEPDEQTLLLLKAMSEHGEFTIVPLTRGEIDYDRLLTNIFSCARVITWW
jgi:hypothetical protein